jgi:predicted O-methyltransferase YrrM
MSRRWNVIKTILKNPGYLMQGSLSYIFKNGHIGKLPTSNVFDLFNEMESEITLASLATISGGATLAELCVISYITNILEPHTIFEFGTLEGRTTLNLALNSPEDCRIFTFDLPEEDRRKYYEKRLKEIKVWPMDKPPPYRDTAGECFRNHQISTKITQLYGDTRTFDFSPYYQKMDLIFIDANHEYEYVKSDSETAMKMLSKQGGIIWHDYPNVMGVAAYLDELFESSTTLNHLWDTRLALYCQKIAPLSSHP